MKETIESWFRQVSASQDWLGFAVRLPDQTCLTQSRHPEFSGDSLASMSHQLADTLASLGQHRIVATHFRWSYDRRHLHLVTRSDGSFLALIATAKAEPGGIARLLHEFVELGGGGGGASPRAGTIQQGTGGKGDNGELARDS